MENVHGKEIPLQYVTVKVPGQKPRGSRSIQNSVSSNATNSVDVITSGSLAKTDKKGEKVLLTGYELIKEPSAIDEDVPNLTQTERSNDTPNLKKRHRRIKSNGNKMNADCDGKIFGL